MYLPINVLLPVERLALGLRAHVEDAGRAGRAARVGLVVLREQAPLGAARHRVNGYLAQVTLLLRREAGAVGRLPADAVEPAAGLRPARRARARQHVHPFDERVQTRRVTLGVVHAEDGAVGDVDAAARVYGDAAAGAAPRAARPARRRGRHARGHAPHAEPARPALHPDRVAFELVNGGAHLAQRLAQARLALAADG